MELDNLDPDVRDEIRYRLIKVKYTRDDPVLQAYMLQQLVDAYKKHKLKIPATVQEYLRDEIVIMWKKLTKQMEQKKKELAEAKARHERKLTKKT